MNEGIFWHPYCESYLPYMGRILDFTPDTIVFMGRFRIEQDALPIEGILVNNDSWVHARIISKEIIEDSDEEDEDPHKGAFYDEEMGGYIRLFPNDDCIQIKYEVIKDLPTRDILEECMNYTEALGKEVYSKSEEIRQAREERELDEYIAERNRLYAEQKAKETEENATTDAIVPDIILKTIVNEESHSDGDESWHCGCEYDPYPDDPYCGGPPPDFEFEVDLRKASGEARHAKKAVYKGNKYHKKPPVFKQECEEHAHHKQRILRNTIASQTKGGDMSP